MAGCEGRSEMGVVYGKTQRCENRLRRLHSHAADATPRKLEELADGVASEAIEAFVAGFADPEPFTPLPTGA